MVETHIVHIERRVGVTIAVTVQVQRGTQRTWWDDGVPDRGWVVQAQQLANTDDTAVVTLTDKEQREAVDAAIENPAPDVEQRNDDDPIDNQYKPF